MHKYSSKWINVSEPSPNVLLVELARAPVNAFTRELWQEFGKLFDKLTEDGVDIRAAVISSVFPKSFCAGLDFRDTDTLGGDGTEDTRDAARAFLATRTNLLQLQREIGAPERATFPVIAAVHGYCIGLGVDLICTCDILYAASDSSFSIKEVDIGFAAGIGSLAYLPHITGNHSLLRELAYTARPFSADEAEKIGLVSKIVEGGRDEVVKEALELAKSIASKSPVAVSGSKHLITHSRDQNTPESLAYTGVWNGAALMTKDISENLRALKTKRPPTFAHLKVYSRL